VSIFSGPNLGASAQRPITRSANSVSVIMPAYNASAYIHDAIASILRQTHRELELIVIDDGSYDDTARRAEVFEKLDARVRVTRTDHLGISFAVNKGIAIAQHEWIAIMPADDIAMPHRLETQLTAAKHDPSVVAWGAFVEHINSRRQRVSISRVGPTSHDEFQRMRHHEEEIYVHHATLFVRKQSLEEVGGYDPNWSECEDLELISRLAQLGDVLAIPETLMLYRVHSSSFTMRHFFGKRQRTRMIRSPGKSETAWDRVNDVARFCYRKAGLAFAEGDLLDGFSNLALSTVLAPHYALPRLWRQRLGGHARRALNQPIVLNAQPASR
jgi:glycosyltransferase involved in cell wall biosynthesis